MKNEKTKKIAGVACATAAAGLMIIANEAFALPPHPELCDANEAYYAATLEGCDGTYLTKLDTADADLIYCLSFCPSEILDPIGALNCSTPCGIAHNDALNTASGDYADCGWTASDTYFTAMNRDNCYC